MRTMQITAVTGCLLLAAGCSSSDKTPPGSDLTLPSLSSVAPQHGETGGRGNGSVPAPRSVDTIFISCRGGGQLKVLAGNSALGTVTCDGDGHGGYVLQKLKATTNGTLRVEAGKSTTWLIAAQ